jgi:hypothetical protein
VTLQDFYNFLNFFINKNTGAYYSPPELDDVVDRGQMSLYSDLHPKYATSQRIKDSLSVFRQSLVLTNANTISGIIDVVTADETYLDLLGISINYTSGGRTIYYPVNLANEDEIAGRLNSQIDPIAVTSPAAEQIGRGVFQLWPKVPNAGIVTYLRRPIKPFFSYTVISGRVIVYDDAASTQLEWRESDLNAVAIKTLLTIGINISDEEISQYAQTKTDQNFLGINRT